MARIWLFLTALVLTGCGTSPRPVVLIGQIAPARGPGQGPTAQQGVRLAVQEVNNDANLKFDYDVKVLHAHAVGESACRAEAVRLKHINQVAALLGGQTSRETAGLDQAGVPVVSAAGFRGNDLSKLVFLTGLSPQVKGQALAELAVGRLPVLMAPAGWSALASNPLSPWGGLGQLLAVSKLAAQIKPPGRVVVVTDLRQQEFVLAANAFVKNFTKLTAEQFPNLTAPAIVNLNFDSDQQLADHIPQLVVEKPEVIVLAGEVAAIWKIRGGAAPKGVPLLFAGSEDSQAALLAGPQAGSGIFLATVWVPDAETPHNQAFTSKFQKMFAAAPDVSAALAYDNARLLFEALRQSNGVFTPGQLREKLAGLKDFELLTGKTSFDEAGQLLRPVYLVQLIHGHGNTLFRYEPK